MVVSPREILAKAKVPAEINVLLLTSYLDGSTQHSPIVPSTRDAILGGRD